MFTTTEIQNLLSIVDFHNSFLIVSVLGKDVLDDWDKFILNQHGIDVDKLKEDYPPTYLQSLMWGRLSAMLQEKDAKELNYSDFEKYIKRGQYIPLSEREQRQYEIARQKTYSHLKGLGTKVKNDITNILSNESAKARDEYEKVIHDEIERGVVERKTAKSIISEIGNRTQVWNHDWGRIVETECNNIFQEGRAQTIAKEKGNDAMVFKDVYGGACMYCIRLYLTNGIGSQPRLFKLSELQANGDNYGLKVNDWKPVVSSTHPHCFDRDTDVLTKDGWVNWSNIKGDELFLSVNPKSREMEWVKANHVVKYKFKGKLRQYKGFSFDLMTTDKHKHFTIGKDGVGRLREESEFGKTEAFGNIYGDWVGESKETIKIADMDIGMKDFCLFMGWWLSDGSISKPKRASSYQLKITQHKEYNKGEIRDVCKRIFDRVWIGDNAIYAPVNDGVAEYFLKFGHAYDKFIPNEIKNSTKENIEIFMEAFRKGDGNIRNKQNDKIKSKPLIYYTTSSPKLLSDLCELIIKMNYRPSIRSIEPKPIQFKNGVYTAKHTQYIINQLRSRSSLYSKIDVSEVEYDDYVYDVELEKFHTLYVKRNGKVTISGNCRCTLRSLPKGYVWDEESGKFTLDTSKKDDVNKVERKSKVKITIGDKVAFV